MIKPLKRYIEDESDLIGQIKHTEYQLANAQYEVEILEKEILQKKERLKCIRDCMKNAFLNILSESNIVEGIEIDDTVRE